MPKGSTIHVQVWMQYGDDKCLKVIGLREGQNGVNKGGSRLINAQECLCKSHLWYVRGMGWKGRLCFWLGIFNPCLGLCTCLGRELGFGLGLA